MKKLLTIVFIILLTITSYSKEGLIYNTEDFIQMLDNLNLDNKNDYLCYTKNHFKNYAIGVNRLKRTVTIYQYNLKDKKYNIPIKCFPCALHSEKTPLGLHKTSNYYRWHELFGNWFGQYCVRFSGHFLFHSSLYKENENPNSLNPNSFNSIINGANSGGCIRLQIKDVKWIYDNCPKETWVYIYESEYPGPINKPIIKELDENILYDPTDIEYLNIRYSKGEK